MIRLEVSTRAIVVLVAALVVLWLALRLGPILLLISISLILAAALIPFVEWMVGRGLSRGVAVLIVTVALIAALAVILLVLVPPLVEQGRALVDRLPEIRARLVQFLDRHHATSLAREVEQSNSGNLVEPGQIASTGRRVVEVLASVVSVLALTIYIVLDARRIERFLYRIIPDKYAGHMRNLFPPLRKTVGGFIRGQLLTSLAITVFTFVVLMVLRVPNALALAVLAGIADVVPLIGAFLAIVPATLAALQISVPTAIAVGAVLTVYQEFENRILIPRVYGSTLRLPTVVVFVALLIGAQLGGIVGAVLSLPFAAALRVIVEYLEGIRSGRIPKVAPPEEVFAPDND